MKQRLLFGLGAVTGAAVAGVAVARSRREAALLAERTARLQRADAANGKNIVILGAGFGGINTANALLHRLPPSSGWKVTLVDRHNYFLFTPLLYHAATGLVDPTSILFPARSLSAASNFTFREATIKDIDLRRQVVHLDDGQLSYDHLVLALGSTTNFFGQQENLRSALTLKSTADAIVLRNRLIDAFERADIATDPEERRRCLTFVVVGGGATGVELVGAMRGLVHGTLHRQYPRIREDEVRLVLLEAMPGILPGLPPELAAYSMDRLRELGVDVRVESMVERVEPEGVAVKGGDYIPSRTVVWAAGVRPSPLAAHLDVPKVKNGRIVVNPYLQVPGFRNLWAIGDIAAVEDTSTGKLLPPNAAVAVQQAKALAEILVARLEERECAPFKYVHRGELVSLGRHEAVADVFGRRITGFPAWALWRAFYLSQLMGFKNQLAVALDWSFAYAYQRDTVRLDVPCQVLTPEEQELTGEALVGGR